MSSPVSVEIEVTASITFLFLEDSGVFAVCPREDFNNDEEWRQALAIEAKNEALDAIGSDLGFETVETMVTIHNEDGTSDKEQL